MKRILNALRPVLDPDEQHDEVMEEVDDKGSEQEVKPAKDVDPNKWDSNALDSIDPCKQDLHAMAQFNTNVAGPSGGPSFSRRLTGFAFGGGTGAPRMAVKMCGAAAPQAAPPPMMMAAMAAPAPCAAPGGPAFGGVDGCAIGFKTGGAQDAANFRENIAAGHLPLPSDVTYEGLIKDYFFDTSPTPPAGWVDAGLEVPQPPRPTELFAPTYSLALAPDPLLAAAASTGGPGPQQSAQPPADAGQKDQEKNGQYSGQSDKGYGASRDQHQDVFLAVGLDSGITNFRRPRLNLCVLLDVSGSMDCGFDHHYYGRDRGGAQSGEGSDSRRSKLDVAKEVVRGMLDKLAPEDSLSISLFSDRAATPKRLGRWGDADAAGIKAGLDTLRTVGGTNFQAGLDEATAQLRAYPDCVDGDPMTTENRLIVLTDAETNCGDISETGLLARLKANAADMLYTTIVGVGLDFQTGLVERIMRVKGASYFSVHSPGEFKRRLEDEFDFMVAPLVFDPELRVHPASLAHVTPAQLAAQQAQRADTNQEMQEEEVEEAAGGMLAEQREGAAVSAAGDAAAVAAAAGDGGVGSSGGGWKVVHVYGSPDSEERRLSGGGSIMRVHTLFPAVKSEEGVKGGVVLLRMRPPLGTDARTAPPLRLSARYADRSGKQYDTLRTVDVPPEVAEAAGAGAGPPSAAFFQSTGVRKAVLLARLVDALQCWLVDEWAAIKSPRPPGNDGWDAQAAASVGAAAGAPRAAPPSPAPPASSAQPGRGRRLLCAGCPLLPPNSRFLTEPASLAGGDGGAPLAPWQRLPTSRWERQAQPLRVGPEAKVALRQLAAYVEAEVAALGDPELQQEVELLRKLVAA